MLQRMLDPNEFLSDYGIRSLSKSYQQNPYSISLNDRTFTVAYEPAESGTGIFGGNSNWRGPIWFPMNFILIYALYRWYSYLGPDLPARMARDLSTAVRRSFSTTLIGAT
jgi:glycogen debranching enzyme